MGIYPPLQSQITTEICDLRIDGEKFIRELSNYPLLKLTDLLGLIHRLDLHLQRAGYLRDLAKLIKKEAPRTALIDKIQRIRNGLLCLKHMLGGRYIVCWDKPEMRMTISPFAVALAQNLLAGKPLYRRNILSCDSHKVTELRFGSGPSAIRIFLKTHREPSENLINYEAPYHESVDAVEPTATIPILWLNEHQIATPFLGQDALDLVFRDHPLPPSRIKSLARDIVFLLRSLNRANVVHADLKPDNLVVVNGRLRLIDFGSSFKIGDLSGVGGTSFYMAPEAIATHFTDVEIPASPLRDVWSMGVFLLNVLGQKEHFSFGVESEEADCSMDALAKDYRNLLAVSQEQIDEAIKRVTKDIQLVDLLCGMVKIDPEKRISLSEIEKHPYLA